MARLWRDAVILCSDP